MALPEHIRTTLLSEFIEEITLEALGATEVYAFWRDCFGGQPFFRTRKGTEEHAQLWETLDRQTDPIRKRRALEERLACLCRGLPRMGDRIPAPWHRVRQTQRPPAVDPATVAKPKRFAEGRKGSQN